MVTAEATTSVVEKVAGEPFGEVRQDVLPAEAAIVLDPVQEHEWWALAVHGRAEGDAVGGGGVVGALVDDRVLPGFARSCHQTMPQELPENITRPGMFPRPVVSHVAAGHLRGEIGTSVDVDLRVDVGQVLLDGVDAHEQAFTDLGVGVAVSDQPHDIKLGRGQ